MEVENQVARLGEVAVDRRIDRLGEAGKLATGETPARLGQHQDLGLFGGRMRFGNAQRSGREIG